VYKYLNTPRSILLSFHNSTYRDLASYASIQVRDYRHRLFSCRKCLTREGAMHQLRPRTQHPKSAALYRTTAPQRRRVKRNLQSVGGKSQRRGSVLKKLRDEIIYNEIIVEGGRKLQHTMSRDMVEKRLTYKGQNIPARVKGPAELEGIGKMFVVFIPSLGKEGFYVHEGVLKNMIVEGEALGAIRVYEPNNESQIEVLKYSKETVNSDYKIYKLL
jgi:hypothetical protein